MELSAGSRALGGRPERTPWNSRIEPLLEGALGKAVAQACGPPGFSWVAGVTFLPGSL